ncbi:MAG TPA: cyclic-di-AMP receptor [Anaerolineales bacterium]|nr:cyclic-di-AMP receptor [Anaerolineales bacterium]
MMKLIIAILHHTDGEEPLRELSEAGFGVTRISSTGGFLRRSSATLLIGVEADRLAAALQLIRQHIGPPAEEGLKRATVFVLNVERHEEL